LVFLGILRRENGSDDARRDGVLAKESGKSKGMSGTEERECEKEGGRGKGKLERKKKREQGGERERERERERDKRERIEGQAREN